MSQTGTRLRERADPGEHQDHERLHTVLEKLFATRREKGATCTHGGFERANDKVYDSRHAMQANAKQPLIEGVNTARTIHTLQHIIRVPRIA